MPGPLIEGSIEVTMNPEGTKLMWRYMPPESQVIPVGREAMDQILADLQTLISMERLLKLTKNCNEWLLWGLGRHDQDEEGKWKIFDEDKLSFAVMCNDVFAWGTADAEYILPTDLDDLERALTEVREIVGDQSEDPDGLLLWVSRKRGMRPQGAFFPHINEKLWSLFHDAAPEREVDMLNPKPLPEPKGDG